MIKYYSTDEVALLLPNYNSARTLLEALDNNRKGKTQSPFLKNIEDCKQKVGKRWFFRKDKIDEILNLKKTNVHN